MNKYIKCPKCNCEYLPGEIYNPDYFLGKPQDIVRSNTGEILGYEGIEMDLEETFECSKCGYEFKVSAKLSFVIDQEDASKLDAPQEVDLF